MSELSIPDYSGLSIQNLANTLLSHFGAVPRGPKLRLDLDINDRVVLILIDGLSYLDLINAMGNSLPVSRLYRITSVFPTTTSTVLTTLFTGLSPGQHGVFGPNVYIKEIGTIVNTLSMGPVIGERDGLHKMGYDLKKLFPIKSTIFEELGNMGIRSRVYVPKGLSGGLSRISYAGAEIVEYVTPYDAIINASKFLSEYRTSFVHIYITTVDSAAHKYGPDSEECNAVIRETVDSVIRMAKKYMADATVLITADHGHDEVKSNVKANDVQGLMRYLHVPPYGDARAVYLKLSDKSSIDELTALLSKHNVAGRFLSRDEAINMGLFGEVSSDVIDRVGDVIFIPNSGSAFIYLYKPDNEELLTLRGQHGGLTERELYIPLIQL
ncbi:alkaline phosphatase family protein [Vulcanisaeta distributa]|uniref:alkaline phosphatase family protein n=1 Tax=Vulcanisaeta distributa TaxID=164451 RepID=UPI0006D1EF5E|nr:alkaline phosphatase family protein [Vulcanisaeta distributa]